MHLASPWIPRLSDGSGLPFEKLSTALADDISDELIVAGDRLPPHRELAYQLGIGVGTVTKAYQALERRGLVQSIRGRGMFVAGLAKLPHGIIDLSINVPPKALSDRLLASTLSKLAKRLDAGTFGTYAPACGLLEHRAAMARWLNRNGMDISADQVLLTHGAQHALSIAFATICKQGSVILTESVTYPGAINLAQQSGCQLIGLDMDEEGILPAKLDQALTKYTGENSPVLYVTPTLQNPTTATMSFTRRQEIVRICCKHDVLIIEDDVYLIFAGPDLPPLAKLAPDRTLHISGMAKALSPGLRVGTLTVPPTLFATANKCLQATCTMASLLDGTIMELWLADGTADSVASSIRSDAARRVQLAKKYFPNLISADTPGFHVWLPMPIKDAESFVARAAAAGIILLPATAPLIDSNSRYSGVRISRGGPAIEVLSQAFSSLESLCGAIKYELPTV